MRASLRTHRACVNRRARERRAPCPGPRACYLRHMPEQSRPAALDRIERAIARIEAAAATDAIDREAMTLRHETLRARVGEAIAALDDLAQPA